MSRSLKVIKLGTVCRDKATELTGTVTHWLCNMEGGIDYLFQPMGLDNEGRPVKKLNFEAARLDVKKEDFEVVDTPFEILGTAVTNKASGFTGMAVEFIRHINGCFHVIIQPRGLLESTKSPYAAYDFDLRECEGEMIPALDANKLKESKRVNPSPTGDDFSRSRSIAADEPLPSRHRR